MGDWVERWKESSVGDGRDIGLAMESAGVVMGVREGRRTVEGSRGRRGCEES